MLCGNCGATTSPELDRCAVCHTRLRASHFGEAGPHASHVGEAGPLAASHVGEAGPLAASHVGEPGPRASHVGEPGSHASHIGEPGSHASHVGEAGPTRLQAPEPQEPATTAAGFDKELTRLSSGHSGNAPRMGGVAAGVHLLQPGHHFGSRYTIIRMLGSGGMAAVYQAWDETLGTAVALKLIRVDAGTQQAELRQLEDRFKRELKLARQVTHPNVVRIHDLGEVDSTLYLTMEYVQGADLATLLQREPKLPLPRVLGLARQIASGLAAAHRAGIVHRDLKPANVMVDAQDHALLMDFGIARSTAAASIHTMPGSLIGTLDYMAPEQARGEPADERTDVYAFGLILYELLAGGRPRYSVEGGLSSLIARLEKGPPALRTVITDVPAGLEQIVNKCLSASPEARYPSANELLADLEALDEHGRARVSVRSRPSWTRVAAMLAIGSVLIAATWWLASRRTPPTPPAARAPLPVLIVDFENRAGDSVFDGALEQALSIAMEGAPFVTAFPRSDAARLVRDLKLGSKLDESSGRLLASREGIPVILAGMIERSGSGYRVSVGAVTPDRQEPTSVAEATASDKAQVLGAVARVAEDLREALGDTTPSSTQQAETFTAASLDAMRAYTIAQDLSTSQRDSEAAEKYREALRHDPEFGRAYSGLGASLFRLGNREEAERNWNEALRRADRMNEREKLRTFGGYYIAIARNPDKAIDTYKQLVAKYPADSAGYNNLAIAYFNTLNFAKAFEYGRKAIEIYPKTYKYRSNYALYAMYAGDFKTVAEIAQPLIKEDPKVDVPYLPLAMEALAAGDVPRARGVYQQVTQAGNSGVSLSALGIADIAMYQGRYDEALSILPAAAKRDQDQQNILGAASKLVALAEAYQARGNDRAQQTSIAQARALSTQENVLVPAARLAIAAGRPDEARKIAAELAQRLSAQSRAYAKMIEGEIAIAAKQYAVAVDALNAAQTLADLWLVRFALGLAYFHHGHYPEAVSEFEKCRERRGEATAVFLDDLPSFHYYATLPYWLGRAREAQKLDARPQFQEFLQIRQGATGDPLVEDARKRVAAAAQ
jgi:tetratricopeptide (TPR) repeat protein/tRNA A-37 threonylcarbamoyl transferase component Bud32